MLSRISSSRRGVAENDVRFERASRHNSFELTDSPVNVPSIPDGTSIWVDRFIGLRHNLIRFGVRIERNVAYEEVTLVSYKLDIDGCRAEIRRHGKVSDAGSESEKNIAR